MSNSTDISRTNLSYSTELKLDHNWEIVFLTMAYVIVFIVGVVGNSFVLAVVIRSPHMWNVTNLFIANLAAADILVLLFCLPFNLVNSLFASYQFGMIPCKLVSWLQGLSVATSVYTLVAISLDRYFAICHPMKFQMTLRTARKACAAIWICAGAFFIPWFAFFQITDNPSADRQVIIRYCMEQWPNGYEHAMKWNLLFNVFILCYVAPLLTISFCYMNIFLAVWKRDLIGDAREYENIVRRQRIQVIKMLLVVVLIFAISWLPLYAIFIGYYFNSFDDVALSYVNHAVPVLQWVSTANSCINPCIYAYLNRKYRQGFKAIVMSGSCCKKLKYPGDRIGHYTTSAVNSQRIVSEQTHVDYCMATLKDDV